MADPVVGSATSPGVLRYREKLRQELQLKLLTRIQEELTRRQPLLSSQHIVRAPGLRAYLHSVPR